MAQLRCHKCATIVDTGLETNPITAYGPFALTISTNEKFNTQEFKTMFSFWDWRRKTTVHICGACLTDKLLSIDI